MKHLMFGVVCLLFIFTASYGQDAPKDTSYWKTGAGIGLDFAQLLQINPKQGAGQNRLGVGGAFTVFAKYKKNRLAWDNAGSWQFGVQKLGSGPLPTSDRVPFQKAIDELRLNSKVGYKTSSGNSKFFYAADLGFLSLLTPTYQGTSEYPGNFLTDITEGSPTSLRAKLFSPATITISLGLDYKPADNLSLYFSPVGGKFIIVADDQVARLGVHGNPVEGEPNVSGFYTSYKKVFAALGALLKTNYVNKFLKDRMTYASTLQLFSNYIENPQNIDLDWNNELGIVITKGLQLALTLNAFYDDDVLVQITDFNSPNGVSGLGKRVSLTQQLLIKYNITF